MRPFIAALQGNFAAPHTDAIDSMLANFTSLDYLVLAVVAAVVLGLAAWAGRGAATTDALLLANRALSWRSLGPSLGLAGLAAVVYCTAPNAAYYLGLKLLLVPLTVWTAAPILLWCIAPLGSNLELDSVYEYLELRFSPAARAIAVAAYFVLQLLWLGGTLLLPLRALHLGPGLDAPVAALLIAAGAVATACVFLGGMKASAWTGAVQLALMAVAAILLVLIIGGSLQDGLPRIGEVAAKTGRTAILDARFDWSADWSAWVAVPYLALVSIYFCVADQSTVQRFFAARDRLDAGLAGLSGFAACGVLIVLATGVGLGLLTFYQEHAQGEIPPQWVARSGIDPKTGQPLIGPDTPIDAQNIGQLVADGAILDPNTGKRFENTEGLIDGRGQVVIDRLATREPSRFGGERRLHAGRDELLARFVERHLRYGLAGLVLAALLSAAMATVAAGLNALATLFVVDLHRRFGWCEEWLVRRCNKLPRELDQTDELRLARPLMLVLGAAVIGVALALSGCGDVLGLLFGALNVVAGPLLGVFLLGLFTRRTTAAAALIGAAAGAVTALWAALGQHLAAGPLAAAWPFPQALARGWPLLFGLAATLAVGGVLGYLVGRRKSRAELAGLVVGLGPLGILREAAVKQKATDDVRWIEGDDNRPPPSPWSKPVR